MAHSSFSLGSAPTLRRRVSPLQRAIVLLVCSIIVVRPALATSFTVGAGATDTAAKTLGAGAGQTGTVAATGALSVSGSTVGVTINATSGTTTVTNSGNMVQTGTGRLLNNTAGTSSIVITNNAGALMRAADADTIRGSVAGSSWTITNNGTISSLNPSAGGSQAIDLDAVTTGTVRITNNAGAVITAYAADAIRPGANAVIINNGTISATLNPADLAPGSDGIDSQNRSGANITNSGSIAGRHGITGGPLTSTETFTTTVTNNAGGTIQGLNGSGINLDGFNANQSATVVNNGTIIGNGTLANSDGDGIDVDGLVNITNTGIIRSVNANSNVAGSPAQSEGISVGGGTITNSGTIEGLVAAGNTNAVGRGISFLGNDITTGNLTGTREAIYGNATVTNQAGGLIRGDSDSGIAVDGPASGFTVTINNNAGATIRGGGTVNAAIRTNADNDTVINAGTIDGSSGGKAVDLGAGNDLLKVTGGNATITGGMDGGTGTDTLRFDLGSSSLHFTQNGTITNFEALDLVSGDVSLLGSLSLGANANVANVRSAAILDLDQNTLSLDQGSLIVDGALRFVFNGGANNGELVIGAGNGGSFGLGSGSSLNLSLGSGFHANYGDVFTLVDLQNSGVLVSGTFSGLAEGAMFTVGSQEFLISYHGNTGNDIVLTAVPDSSTTLALLAASFGLMIGFRRRIRG